LSEGADRLAQLARVTQDLSTAHDDAEGHARRIESRARAAEERLSSMDAHLRGLAEAVTGIKATVDRLDGAAQPQREQVEALERRVVTIVQTLKKASE
jgi:chromosome segregation ATPase